MMLEEPRGAGSKYPDGEVPESPEEEIENIEVGLEGGARGIHVGDNDAGKRSELNVLVS